MSLCVLVTVITVLADTSPQKKPFCRRILMTSLPLLATKLKSNIKPMRKLTMFIILFTAMIKNKKNHVLSAIPVTRWNATTLCYSPSSRSLANPGSAPVERTKSERTASISTVMWSWIHRLAGCVKAEKKKPTANMDSVPPERDSDSRGRGEGDGLSTSPHTTGHTWKDNTDKTKSNLQRA